MQDTETDIEADAEAQAEATTTAAAPRSETRYPLAFDANGNPLQVPAHAVAWRVRRGGGKRGRPRNVFDASTGRQLEIALGASIEDLAETNVPADRYLLYPIDAQGAIIPGVVAVTEVTEGDDDGDDEREERGAALNVNSRDPILAVLASLRETIQGQHEVIKAASEHLAKSLGSAVSGYAPVRAALPPMAPTPIMMEQQPAQAAPADGGGILAGLMNMKPEQMIQLATFAQQMFATIKGAASAASGGAVGVGGIGGGP